MGEIPDWMGKEMMDMADFTPGNYVFIGGSMDGKKAECDRPHVCILKKTPNPVSLGALPMQTDLNVRRESYEAVLLATPSGGITVFILCGMDHHEAMWRLIEWYELKSQTIELVDSIKTGLDQLHD